MRVKRDWSKLLQPVLLPLAFIVGIGSFILVADGKTKKTTKPPPDSQAAVAVRPASIRPAVRLKSRGPLGIARRCPAASHTSTKRV